MPRHIGIAILLLTAALPWPTSAEPADATPEALRPFLPFVEKCRQWHARDRGLEWKLVYDEKFDQGDEYWAKIDKNLKLQQTDGKSELVVAAPVGETLFAPIGPKINGQCAIEMVARAEGQKANPLSIILGMERGLGPGFQFSTRPDGEHQLWIEAIGSSNSGGFQTKRLGKEPQLVIGQRYRIRLEVREGEMAVSIDGKPFAKAPVSALYDWDKLHQPTAMTVIEPMVVSSYRIEKLLPSEDNDQEKRDAATWKKLFGESTREQVEAEAGKLMLLLDDDAWAVREGATQLLRDVGDFALPALRDGLENGSAEVKLRAEQLIGWLDPANHVLESPAQPVPQPEQIFGPGIWIVE